LPDMDASDREDIEKCRLWWLSLEHAFLRELLVVRVLSSEFGTTAMFRVSSGRLSLCRVGHTSGDCTWPIDILYDLGMWLCGTKTRTRGSNDVPYGSMYHITASSCRTLDTMFVGSILPVHLLSYGSRKSANERLGAPVDRPILSTVLIFYRIHASDLYLCDGECASPRTPCCLNLSTPAERFALLDGSL